MLGWYDHHQSLKGPRISPVQAPCLQIHMIKVWSDYMGSYTAHTTKCYFGPRRAPYESGPPCYQLSANSVALQTQESLQRPWGTWLLFFWVLQTGPGEHDLRGFENFAKTHCFYTRGHLWAWLLHAPLRFHLSLHPTAVALWMPPDSSMLMVYFKDPFGLAHKPSKFGPCWAHFHPFAPTLAFAIHFCARHACPSFCMRGHLASASTLIEDAQAVRVLGLALERKTWLKTWGTKLIGPGVHI